MNYNDLSPIQQDQLEKAENAYQVYKNMGQERRGEIVRYATYRAVLDKNTDYLRAIQHMRHVPVNIDEFLESPEFLGASVGNIEVWPSLREDLRNMHPDHMLGGSPVLEVILAGATGCVDGDTEYLSPKGWVKIKDYPGNTKVAQFHPGGQISFMRPLKYIKKPCDEFYHFTGKGIDQVLSPEHRVYYSEDGKTHIKSAKQVAALVKDKNFKGKILTTFTQPSKGLEVSEMALRAIIICTLGGKFMGYSNVCLLSNLKDVQRTKDIFKAAGVKYKTLSNNALYVQSPTFNSELPDSFYLATDRQLHILIEECLYSIKTTRGLETTSKQTAGILQYACARLGIRTELKKDGKIIIVTIHKNPEVGITSVKTVAPKKLDPFKYCFEVKTSLLVLRRNGKIFITGNTGKSFLCSVSICYLLYYLTCFNRPQSLWKLDKFTAISIPLMSVKESVARKVLYEPIRRRFTSMPYCEKWVGYNKQKEHVLELADDITLSPGVSGRNSYIGQATIGGIMDEINFLSVIENSRQVAGPDGKGGLYDQAAIIYNELTTRRLGRFRTKGPNPGGFYIPSSAHYEDDFIEKRIKQIDPVKDQHVMVIRRSQYEAQPSEFYCGDKFKYLVSTKSYPARIIQETDVAGVDYPADAPILEIPIEYESKFRNDPEQAQRDILGIASGAINRFIYNTKKIADSMKRAEEKGMKSWVKKQNVMAKHGMPEIIPANLPDDLDKPRFVHVDLAISKDRCGIALCKVNGYETVTTSTGLVEKVPNIEVELVVTIEPHSENHVDIAAVRQWILGLKEQHGVNIIKITFDRAHSSESRQLVNKAGIISEVISVDKTAEPYEALRRLLYEDRIDIIPNTLLAEELACLEKDESTQKIDHAIKFSKDAADAVAGCVFSALKNRDIRTKMDIISPSGRLNRPTTQRRSFDKRR